MISPFHPIGIPTFTDIPWDHFGSADAQQIADRKGGARKFSAAITEADVEAAAAYYSALKPRQTIKVVEADNVPKTYIARLVFAKSADGGTEPLVPDDLEQFELRNHDHDSRRMCRMGSIAKGEALAKPAGQVLLLPVTCHGPDLRGVGPIPRIAGRSPGYVVRQLYDFRQGVRAGSTGALMKPAVGKLSVDDMISLAAYVASLEP